MQRKFKNTFKTYFVNDIIPLDIVENINSITVYNNGPTGICIINTGFNITPAINPGMKFIIDGKQLELYYYHQLKLIPAFGLPQVTVIFKTFI